MPLGILIILIQVAFGVHAVKTGKDPIWLWIIALLPGIGCLIYFITQFGPDAASSRSAKLAKKRLVSAIDPSRELRNRVEALEISDTIENRVALAQECIEAGMYDDAMPLLVKSLSGLHENDPQLLEMLARCQFEGGDPASAVGTLDTLITKNPEHKSVDGHLLYARSVEAKGDIEGACREYDALIKSYTGEEARVRYAMLLKRLGRNEQASALFKESLTRSRHAPAHYQKKEREWLAIAKREGN